MRADRRRLLLAAALVAVAAIAARAPGEIGYPLWQDEVASARIVSEPSLADAVSRVADTESTPPAWYVAGWVLDRAGAPTEDVRWLSVLCGAAAAVLTLLFARRFLGLPAATLAGLVVALSWQLVERGHELRAYSLYLLLAVAFALLLDDAARRPGRGRLAGLAAVSALGLLTHYFFALALAAGLVWLWTWPPARPARTRVTVALAVSVVPLLAWIPGFAEQVGNGRYNWVAGFDALKAAALYSTFFWNADELYVEAQHVTIPALDAVGRVAILALVLAGAVRLWRIGFAARLAALLATVPGALATILWVSGGSVFTTRNLICAAPFAAIALAALVEALPRPAALAAGAAAVALLGLGLVQEWTLRPPPYDRFADELAAAGWSGSDPVYVLGGAHRLSYLGSSYALRSPIGWYLPGRPMLRLADAPTDCDRPVFVVDGAARPVAVSRLDCGPGDEPSVRPGGYWFRAPAAG
ncbi:MAG TPA: glycosyltransferase family 39 protein [Gaiellaceae bacterium]